MDIAVIIGEIAFISRSKIMDGIVDAAKKNGDNVILFTSEGFIFHHLKDYSEGEYNVFTLPALENYDGVILDLDSIQNDKIREYLYDNVKNSNVPTVSFNREINGTNQIVYDNERGFEQLVRHLVVDHKVKDFHYISGPFGNRDAKERFDIFKRVLAENDLTIADENVYESDFNFSGGKEIASIYINKEKELPEAFVAANDFMAIGLMEELRNNGIKIPEDVIVTGYDNCEIAAYTSPRLTTVDRGEYASGVLAYERLVENIKGIREGSKDVVYGTPIFAGSCGCCMEKTENLKLTQSVVDLKIYMDDSLDLLKGLNLGFSHMTEISHFQQIFEKYIQQIGMETFYFCQCGSRESYYEELELMANGGRIKRNQTVYQDTVWCPFAYERGEWHSYPSYSKKLLFPPSSNVKKDGSYYIVMPVHQGKICIGYSIIGNFQNRVSGRVLQHLVLDIDAALGNIYRNDIMNTMLAKINQKWQYDELTGLYNRSGYVNNAMRLIDEAKSKGQGICAIFFDLNGLKKVNDEKGHEVGDQYIKSMADTLKNSADATDIVCRYGGDEYIVISAQNSWEDCVKKLNFINSNIKEPLSASAGYVFDFVSGMDGLKLLIEEADKRMYEYKKKMKRERR